MEGKIYNFDEVIDRKQTESAKWGFLEEDYGDPDIIPLPVADMDFRSPDEVVEAIQKRAAHGIFGYTKYPRGYMESVVGWMEKRFQWTIQKDWIVSTPGVVAAIFSAERAFTHPGDKVIIQPPIYYPFLMSNMIGRNLQFNPLKFENGHYSIDFDDLAEKAKDPMAKLMVISNPHNPVGRVFTKEELTRMGDICLENDILMVSDEIHADLLFKGYKHTPYASISEEFAQNSIVCTAGSKTFNIAGLHNSNIIIPNEKIREVFKTTVLRHCVFMTPGVFGSTALQAAYTHGESWLSQVMEYVEANYNFMKGYLEQNLPGVKVLPCEGTYLIWADFRCFDMDPKEMERVMRKEARVALDEGYIFGPGGAGFERFNVACPRSTLREALNRIITAFKPYLKQ